MANPYPANFEDGQGTRLEGQIDFTDRANQPGGSLPDPITDPVTVALPAAGLDALSISADDTPVARIFAGMTAAPGGGAVIDVHSAADGQAAIVLIDDGTADGLIKWQTTGSYIQPRSASADADAAIECADKDGNDALVYQAGGSLIFGRKVAIPDANLANSQFGFWLDDTPGATKLMVKAKDSGGTVRTAAIALT